MDKFVARENVRHLRHQLESGADTPRRATLLRLLIEQLNDLEPTREQLDNLDRHIARLGELMARQAELVDGFGGDHPRARAELVLATMNDIMATYIDHRQNIAAALADGSR